MSTRPLIIATLLGASVGVPYLASHSGNGPKSADTFKTPPATNYFSTQSGTVTRLPGVMPSPPAAPQLPAARAITNAIPIDGAQFTSIDQVIRFDVSKEWVYQNWSRKSTGPTDVGLFSVRVPLVMAPRLNSLAGSLTYYFNDQGQVEHISFRGRTGDSTQLVELLTRTYGLERVPSPTGQQVYQAQYRRQVQSELRTHPEAILLSNAPNQSIAVELELARPGSARVLPPRPTGFESLQVASTLPPAAEASSPSAVPEKTEDAAKSTGSYFDKIRHATPKEEAQVLWKRWPN